MKKNIALTEKLLSYCEEYFCSSHPILKELQEKTSKMPEGKMQITALQGGVISFLIKLIKAERVLEFGTYTGYSTLVMAFALPESGEIITCDKNPEWTKIAKEFWEKAGQSKKIQLIIGDAVDTIKTLKGPFDFIFIDADKKNYPLYYESALSSLSPNGLIAVDNTLWSGKVADTNLQDETTEILKEFNDFIKEDPRVESCLIPIGDGMTLIQKRA